MKKFSNRLLAAAVISFIIVFFSLNYISNDLSTTSDLEKTLKLAGDNRNELIHVLNHYRKNPQDSMKFRAACYIISNMRWHTTNIKSVQIDPNFEKIVRLADSMYYHLVKGMSTLEINSFDNIEKIENIRTIVQDSIKGLAFDEPKFVRYHSESNDLMTIKSTFLIEHIDNAFEIRRKSPFVGKLSFEDFCEYTIPYSFVDGIYQRVSGKKLNAFFSKYLSNDFKIEDLPEVIAKYNLTIRNIRRILGDYPFQEAVGFEELFFERVPNYNCFNMTNFCSIILNSCGIPVSVQFNVAFKMLAGKHSTCTLAPQLGNWNSFSPETDFLTNRVQTTHLMNLYRIHFSAQKNTPFFLKNLKANEQIPSQLNQPRLTDITSSQLIFTSSIKLPFKAKTKNHLAYLEAFNSESGTVPVTWGVINLDKGEVEFKHVILDRLYFPVYYMAEKKKSFGRPFEIQRDSTSLNGYRIIYYDDNKYLSTTDAILTRKYPGKSNLSSLAKSMIGMTITGFNQNQQKTDTLYQLDYAPLPYLQDIKLKNRLAYKNYIIEIPESCPVFNISEVELLTDKKMQHDTYISPSPLPVFSPYEKYNKAPHLFRVLDKDINDTFAQKESDGDLKTAPLQKRKLFFKFKGPQMITRVRFAPLVADNGITKGEKYQLYIYNDGYWEKFDNLKTAEFNFIEFHKILTQRIYWLKNMNKGKEELPFTLDKNGRQIFFYTKTGNLSY